jgi:hypothetical protein
MDAGYSESALRCRNNVDEAVLANGCCENNTTSREKIAKMRTPSTTLVSGIVTGLFLCNTSPEDKRTISHDPA